jgi:PAS domain S-box-containing protein
MNETTDIAEVIGMESEPMNRNDDGDRQKRNRLFKHLFLSAPDLIYTVDIDGNFRLVNDRAFFLTGYTQEELLDMHYLDLVASEHRDRVQNFYIQQIIDETDVTYLEYPIVKKSGEEIWIGQSVSFLLDSDNPGFQAIARDVSAKHAKEQELIWTREQYGNLFEHAVVGMMQISVDGRIKAINSAMVRMLGYDSMGELTGKNISDFHINPRDHARVSTILEANGRSYNVELQLKRKDESVISVLGHSRAIKDIRGAIVMYESIFENTAALHTVEEKLQHYIVLLNNLQGQLSRLPDKNE